MNVRSPWLRRGCFLLLVLGALRSWHREPSLQPAQPPLPQDPYIQVYFNHSQAAVYTEPYRQITRYGDNLEQVILDTIDQAQHSLDIAVQEINLPQVAAALCDRNSHLRIRLILENTYSQPWSQRGPSGIAALDSHQQAKYDNFLALVDADGDGQISAEERQQDAVHQLQQCGIAVIDDTADGSKGSGLMHHKFMVIDGQRVLTGSTNWTASGIHGDGDDPHSRGNANALLVLQSAELAAQFTAEFEQMWGDGPGGQPDSRFGLQKIHRSPRRLGSLPGSTVTVQFSPTSASRSWEESVNALVARTLQQARSRVDLALFVFSDQGISNVLGQRPDLQLRALIDRSFIYRSYSEALDMLGTATVDHQCRREPHNQPWGRPVLTVGTPELAAGDKLHHKFALIDATTVIVGSQNWSDAANTTNDENLLVITNPTVAAHFRREFERLYEGAQLGMTPDLLRELEQRRRQCGAS